MKNIDIKKMYWVNRPEKFSISEDKIEITTLEQTDFWQNTYYNFKHDNAHALLFKTAKSTFSFTFKTQFNSSHKFDQCGAALYQDSENWVKAAIEYNDEQTQWLGSVVTNDGFSDWATTDIAAVNAMWYRLSRRGSDYCLENSYDGVHFKQMRIFHLKKGDGEISIGIMACSPTKASFTAVFTDMDISDCKWKTHQE